MYISSPHKYNQCTKDLWKKFKNWYHQKGRKGPKIQISYSALIYVELGVELVYKMKMVFLNAKVRFFFFFNS